MFNRKSLLTAVALTSLTTALALQAAPDAITPHINAPASAAHASSVGASKLTTPVNINTADLKALESVKGLGGAKAQAIIDYRSKHGNFNSVSDLENVPGVGPKLLKKLEPQLSVK